MLQVEERELAVLKGKPFTCLMTQVGESRRMARQSWPVAVFRVVPNTQGRTKAATRLRLRTGLELTSRGVSKKKLSGSSVLSKARRG